jgi:hypothetical protein
MHHQTLGSNISLGQDLPSVTVIDGTAVPVIPGLVKPALFLGATLATYMVIVGGVDFADPLVRLSSGF